MKQEDIEKGLRDLGLGQGDCVLLHSSLSSLGAVENGAEAVVDAFLAVLGPGGSLAVPRFGDLGRIAKAVEERAEAVTSVHPKARVAAIGAGAEEICRDHWKAETAHGEATPYTRLAAAGGYVCLLGVDQDRNTTLHTPEALLRLAYLQPTEAFTFSTDEGEITRSWPFFPGPHRNFIGLDRLLLQRGIMQMGRIGSAVVRLIKSAEMIDLLVEIGREDPAFALCDNPQCADCVEQRAALRRHRFEQESFRLVAAGSLAGRYVPEMVENCRRVGIEAVELDCVQGLPVQILAREKLQAAVSELRREGCVVTALRASAVGEELAVFLQAALDCGIKRVVLPLTYEAGAHARLATKMGVGLALYNGNLSSKVVFEIMQSLRVAGLEAGLSFSPASFARCGEKPFLDSYNNKLKRFTDQLEVEDCTFDGVAAPLGRANAEIKELVSILRCSSFPGYMVLGAGNRTVGNLEKAVERFTALLDRM